MSREITTRQETDEALARYACSMTALYSTVLEADPQSETLAVQP